MSKKIIYTKNAPEPIGPYSQAVAFKDLVFLSGQIGIDPVTGDIVSGGTSAQLKQILSNIEAVLLASDLTKQHLLKLTIYVTDIYDFKVVNELMTEFLVDEFPARETVEVSALPKGAKIEISAIAGK